ncbi:MAG: winged helix-turn-helix transcriptional regulator [Bdellovibrionaceae bacterium]|jgi:DNA-binding transcriptional ArsR family regulator|nr:winged helix-turn-helix transcriptional regulator [Pseudobdellovibrionaceae bacterium]
MSIIEIDDSPVQGIPNKQQCAAVAQTLKTMAHPQRLMILCQLIDGPKTVTELEKLSGATQSAVSQFLNRMKLENLVACERNSHFVTYKIADENVKNLIHSLHKIYCQTEEA